MMETETLDKLYLEWSQFTKARTSRELELLEACKALSKHLTALTVMCRDSDLTRWNSGATVDTLEAARDVIAKAEKL